MTLLKCLKLCVVANKDIVGEKESALKKYLVSSCVGNEKSIPQSYTPSA